MARILLHTLVFAPDGVSTSALLSELMQDLTQQGHQITVLTTTPHYNRDLDAEAQQPLTQHLGGLYYTSQHFNMRVIHTYMPRKRQGVSGRSRDYLIFHVLSLVLGIFLLGRQDVVIAPSPPLTIGIIGWLLAVLKRAKFIYNVRELFPDLFAQMGLMPRGSRLYRFLGRVERFIYHRASRVVVICGMFRQHVEAQGIPEHKIALIPDFVDTDFIAPQSKDNPLARELKLVDKYVFLYAGNIGLTQSFDTILTVIQQVNDLSDVHFLIVGDGARREYLAGEISRLQLTNVTLLPYQPRSVVPDIYATCDVGLVPLMRGTAKTTIPSKIYTILAAGRPALVSVDFDSEIVGIVEQGQCGLAVEPDSPAALEAGIRQMTANREQYRLHGENGRRYAETHYSRQAVNQAYHHLIEEITHAR